ncbi:hypothetical protein GCM10010521_62690 [Streptomyces rameus]|uniref:DUF11 domain-containing protein n=2 Tax=Streptomyces TaxID=1883 RepID=A0ABN3V340_9ACTN
MKRLCGATIVVATAMALLASFAAAQAAPSVRAPADVRFQYDPPEISEAGDHVTWHWTVVNSGIGAAHKVVLTHTVTPQVPITHVTGPCTTDEARAVVRCTWEQLGAGQRTDGTIDADLPEGLSGSVRIKGRVVFQESPSGTSAAE